MPEQQKNIQRQISLPISKAIEIAWKSIRLRLARSLVVTSSIALAIAFLLSILAGEAIVDSLRAWRGSFESSPQFSQMLAERKRLEDQLHVIDAELRAALRAAPSTQHAAGVDFRGQFGADLDELKNEIGALPAPPAELRSGLATSAEARQAFGRWIESSRQLKSVRDRLAAPEVLAGKLKDAGVATTAQEIRDSRLQTRWVIGLALLVAFVGILNAMLMSVTERFREIGTMKCLGALDGFIVKLFLLESLFQGGVGTLAGVLIGVLLSLAAAAWSFGGFAWQTMPWGQIGVISLICLVIGVVLTIGGALYPAWQAARMQPIAAMRVEV